MSNLYVKYRPKQWDEVLGNTKMIANLRALIEQENPPHAYLLSGPSGCGKTTIARIAATALGCSDLDFNEVDSADFRGIDMVRDLRHKSGYTGLKGLRRVWLIDECHKLTNDAQNALLKGLEDPPDHCFYFLATTDPDRLIKTVRGRCIPQEVEPLSMNDMVRLLSNVCNLEGRPLGKNVLRAIAKRHSDPAVDLNDEANFSKPACYPRFALQLLAKVIVAPEKEQLAVIEKDSEVHTTAANVVKTLLSHGGWQKVRAELVKLSDDDVESVRWGCINYCREILLKGPPGQHGTAADIIDALKMPFFNSGLAGLTLACYTISPPAAEPIKQKPKNRPENGI